jgi:hypothetical protein
MLDYKFSSPIHIGNHVFVGVVGDTRPVVGKQVFGKFLLVDEHGREWNRDMIDALEGGA